MSDEEDIQYVKKTKTIHYGSLEDSEKARIEAQNEESNDAQSSAPAANSPVQETSGK